MNQLHINPIFPLIENEIDKRGVFRILTDLGLRPPSSYADFNNNNCLGDPDGEKGGCIQGGIGYWKKIQKLFPKKFQYMANLEHEFTDRRGAPVTVLTHTINKIKEPLFLLPHPKYPLLADISTKTGRYKVETFECHGFCGTLERNQENA